MTLLAPERHAIGTIAANTPLQITPTDIAQFVRLDQCARYLRLRLAQRNGDPTFMRDYGVVPQSIPPLLTRSGETFERQVERAITAALPAIHCKEDPDVDAHDDNARVLRCARALRPGEVVVLFQPRLQARLGRWRIRGDIDVLRMERDADGTLHALIADIKSSARAKVEHRLQVAFYHEMLTALCIDNDIGCAGIDLAILYRGAEEEAPSDEDAQLYAEQRAAAAARFGIEMGLLEVIADPEPYLGAVRDLVTDPQSPAASIARAELSDVPFVLDYKCDGCMFNEFCMKWSAEHDDLSLLPYLTAQDKAALEHAGVTTTRALATLKEFRDDRSNELMPTPGKEALVRRLAATWPVGPRLDELVQHARRYRAFKGDDVRYLPYIPTNGHGSLPYCAADHNPNLVRVYIDAQHDYLHNRVYLVGALVVASEGGREPPQRRRSVVQLSAGPPDSAEVEERLLVRWIAETTRAIVELAAPDAEGNPRAPIHLIFFNGFARDTLLEALARHFRAVLGATPLYDFVTQIAAFDSAIATLLDEEIRELKNYPMVCQSLASVAAFLGFDWNAGTPYRELFRTRIFDFWSKLDEPPAGERPWYTGRARFNSQIPLEYAYAAWGEAPPPAPGRHDDFAPYREATPELLWGFAGRRLEALERIAHDFNGNKLTMKGYFDLPDLATFTSKADTLAQALDEFVTLERHAELAEWKAMRLMAPERRVLAGETLLVRYCEADQDAKVAAYNRENERRRQVREEYKANNPGKLPKNVSAETRWSQDGLHFRLRLECDGLDCNLDDVLGLTTLREGESVVVFPRFTVDSRLPAAEQTEFTPTPKQLLYGTGAKIVRLDVERDAQKRAVRGWVELEMNSRHGARDLPGFAFSSMDRPLQDGTLYTLDTDPNALHEYHCAKVVEALLAGSGHNALYDRLTRPESAQVRWPAAAAAGQERFLAGLDALHRAGRLDPFEPSKRDYIGDHGDAPVLLVQGPPGTGKSYTTAFALLARMQGAMAGNRDFRALISCKTHAASDVLLAKIVEAQERLRAWQRDCPEIFGKYFDSRLLDVPMYRLKPKSDPPAGVVALYGKQDSPKGAPLMEDVLIDHHWCVAGAAPGGIYTMTKDAGGDLLGHELCDCLVLDEASQMSLPEAIMAALPLRDDGQLIVVGDHRQMPPIVKHNWEGEPRRTFAEFRAYESLFAALIARVQSSKFNVQRDGDASAGRGELHTPAARGPGGHNGTAIPADSGAGSAIPMIKFEESFRLHADMAEFLRREIYAHDGIDFHSNRHERLRPVGHDDPFVAGVLTPEHPLVVVVHDETDSILQNRFEAELIAPVLAALADPASYNLGAQHGLGVVVPHRAQRALLRESVSALNVIDPDSGAVTLSAVDTVERFQGDERDAIFVSATESDPQYILLSSDFLLDPRRLTVALSRAKRKMVLVASRSVFNLFSADEETFANSQLWKNLLRRTCTVLLWEGERDGGHVQVWGNEP